MNHVSTFVSTAELTVFVSIYARSENFLCPPYAVAINNLLTINLGHHGREILEVKRALRPKHSDLVVAGIDGEFAVKQFC